MPGWSASGASRSTSDHASSSSAAPWAERPEAVGTMCRLRPPDPRTHWTRAMNGGAAVGVGDEVGTDVVAVDEVAVLEPAVAGGPVGVAVGLAVKAAGGSGAGVEQPARTAARHAHTVTASAARASGEAVMPAIITHQRGPGRHSCRTSKRKGVALPSALNV